MKDKLTTIFDLPSNPWQIIIEQGLNKDDLKKLRLSCKAFSEKFYPYNKNNLFKLAANAAHKYNNCIINEKVKAYSVKDFVVLPNGNIVTIEDYSSSAPKMWDNNGNYLKTLGHLSLISYNVNSLTLLPDGKILYCDLNGLKKSKTYIWDTENVKCIHVFDICLGKTTYIGNNKIASFSRGSYINFTIKIRNLNNFNSVMELIGHSCEITDVIRLPDGKLASISNDRTVKIWDINTGICLHTLPVQYDAVVALLTNKKIITSSNYAVKIWDILTGECLKEINTKTQQCIKGLLSFSDGNFASFSHGQIDILNPHNEQLINRIKTSSSSTCTGKTVALVENGNTLYYFANNHIKSISFTSDKLELKNTEKENNNCIIF